MSTFDAADIDYPFTVTVERPTGGIDADGNFSESFETVVDGMAADIQLSLRVRNVLAEDETGAADNTVWLLFAKPPAALKTGDRVSDGERTFRIEAVGDWGSHIECVMTLVQE